jgi:hypothetical protein
VDHLDDSFRTRTLVATLRGPAGVVPAWSAAKHVLDGNRPVIVGFGDDDITLRDAYTHHHIIVAAHVVTGGSTAF